MSNPMPCFQQSSLRIICTVDQITSSSKQIFGEDERKLLKQLKTAFINQTNFETGEGIELIFKKIGCIFSTRSEEGKNLFNMLMYYALYHLNKKAKVHFHQPKTFQEPEFQIVQPLNMMFFQIWSLNRQIHETDRWKTIDLIQKFQYLLYTISQNSQQFHSYIENEISKCIYYNQAICYEKINMFDAALSSLQKVLITQRKNNRFRFLYQKCFELKLKIEIKMGRKVQQNKEVMTLLDNQIVDSAHAHRQTAVQVKKKQISQLVHYLNVDVADLQDQIARINNKIIHVHTYFNLGLIAKRLKQTSLAIFLFQSLIRQMNKKKSNLGHSNILRKHIMIKCYINLAQIFEGQRKYETAIRKLQKIRYPQANEGILKEVKLKIISLQASLKCQLYRVKQDPQLQKKSELSLKQSHQYMLFVSQENLLKKVISQAKTRIVPEASSSKKIKTQTERTLIYRINQKRKKAHKMSLTQFQDSKPVSIRTRSSRFDISKKNVKVEETAQSISSEVSQDAADEVFKMFNGHQVQILQDLQQQNYEKCFQKIQKFIEDFQIIEDQLDTFQAKHSLQIEQKIYEIRLKTIEWYKQIGRQRFTISLYKKYIAKYNKNQHYLDRKKGIMRELAQFYAHRKQYKNALDVYMELVKLNDVEALCRIGEIQLVRQNYSQSLKYYDRYAEMKGNDIQSTIKLANVYSKMPTYSKKAIEMLNDLLFTNPQIHTYNNFNSNQLQFVQSGVLLLANTYQNIGCVKKAIQICESYVCKNIGAYNIFYVLGMLYLQEKDIENSFASFLNAIRLNSSHMPSFVEITALLKDNINFRGQVIILLRKAFMINHRNAQILHLLIQIVSNESVDRQESITVNTLIHYADLLENVDKTIVSTSFTSEIQNLYLWAIEIIDERKNRLSVLNQKEYQKVYLKLGAINLEKGNYIMSQKYYRKLQKKISLLKDKNRRNKDLETVQLEYKVLSNLGYIKLKQFLYDEAIQIFNECIQLKIHYNFTVTDVESCINQERIGFCYYSLQCYEKALIFYNQVLEELEKQLKDAISKEKVKFALKKKKYILKLGKIKNNAMQEPKIQYTERYINLKLKIALCHEKNGNFMQAKSCYKDILLKSCVNKIALMNLANIYQLQKQYERCLELTQTCLKLYPQQIHLKTQIFQVNKLIKEQHKKRSK